jgi:cell division protease FtsH
MLGEVQEMIFLGREISEQRNYSEDTARAIDAEVKRLVDIAHQRALQILRNNMDVLHDMAAKLIEIETLDGEELRDVLSRVNRFDPASNGYNTQPLPATAAA